MSGVLNATTHIGKEDFSKYKDLLHFNTMHHDKSTVTEI